MPIADDFLPAMLKSFLRLRVVAMARTSYPSFGKSGERSAKAELRKRSGVSREDFDLAFDGLLVDVESRRQIWAALWLDPADFGVKLTDDSEVQP